MPTESCGGIARGLTDIRHTLAVCIQGGADASGRVRVPPTLRHEKCNVSRMVQREAECEASSAWAARRGLRQRCRAPRSLGAICLVCSTAAAAITACGDDSGQSLYRARPLPGGQRDNQNRDVRPGKGGAASWGARPSLSVPDASARGSGSSALDAGAADAGAAAAAALPDAGLGDAGSASDAGESPEQALSDAQILRVADTLDAIEIDQAQAVLPLLGGPELQTFAQEMLDQHQLARDSWSVLAGALDLVPVDSALADELQADAAGTLQQLLRADPELLPALYLSTEVADHDRAIELLNELIGAADADTLRAQLTVWRTIASDHRAAAEQLATDLAASSSGDAGG